eukprot:scaffold373559_cov18-Prasinocladus_malaysianus.AAC.1
MKSGSATRAVLFSLLERVRVRAKLTADPRAETRTKRSTSTRIVLCATRELVRLPWYSYQPVSSRRQRTQQCSEVATNTTFNDSYRA